MNQAKFKIGDVFYDRHNYKCHIVAILEEEERQFVYKYYGKHKQWWHYFVKSEFGLNESLKIGLWTLKPK